MQPLAYRHTGQSPKARMGAIYRSGAPVAFPAKIWTCILAVGRIAKKQRLIDPQKHLILTSGHPSPLSANRGYWFGNRHFSQVNTYLRSHHKSEIQWEL